MTNSDLIAYMRAHIGQPLSSEIAADICMLADRLPILVRADEIDRIQPEQYGEFTFSVERMEDIQEEIKPLHQTHWAETEEHRHSISFNPDYGTFFRYERAGRAVVFTLRKDGVLLGNFSLYLDKSMHTQRLLATEDTLFLMPEARTGRTAMRFIAYAEKALKQIGVKEIDVSVKLVNKAGRFFQIIGYRHTANGLSKILE
jgi:hypothetical protein